MFARCVNLEELFSAAEFDSSLVANDGQLIVAHHKSIYLGKSKKTGEKQREEREHEGSRERERNRSENFLQS